MIPSYLYKCSFPTGSNYICNPPVTNTDIDEMFYVDKMDQVIQWLQDNGWTKCGAEEYPIGQWTAWRKDNLNALITWNMKYFMDFYKATEEAKRLNLLDKKDRIALFEKYVPQVKHKSIPKTKYTVNEAQAAQFANDVRVMMNQDAMRRLAQEIQQINMANEAMVRDVVDPPLHFQVWGNTTTTITQGQINF